MGSGTHGSTFELSAPGSVIVSCIVSLPFQRAVLYLDRPQEASDYNNFTLVRPLEIAHEMTAVLFRAFSGGGLTTAFQVFGGPSWL